MVEGIVVEIAVIDGLSNPDAATTIHVHIGGVVKEGAFGPEAHFQVVGEVEFEGVLGLRIEEQRDQKEEKYGGKITSHVLRFDPPAAGFL